MAETEFERYKYDQARAYLTRARPVVQGAGPFAPRSRHSASSLKVCGQCPGEGCGDCAGADRMADTVARLQELVEGYCSELAGYVAEQDRAHACVRLMERPEHVQAITGYYLLGRPWERVCADMGYTLNGMMKLRRRAVTEFYDVMPTEWRDPRHPAL